MATSNDYPPAHDPKDKVTDEAEDLVKLTEKSLITGKKPSQSKPRPVVVKFDDGEVTNVTTDRTGIKADLISGAVSKVLLGDDATTSSSSRRKPPKSRRVADESSAGIAKIDQSEHSKAGSKHHGHGKERRRQSSAKDKEHDRKDKQKSDSAAHGKHRSRHRADKALEAQAPVIPDFLL